MSDRSRRMHSLFSAMMALAVSSISLFMLGIAADMTVATVNVMRGTLSVPLVVYALVNFAAWFAGVQVAARVFKSASRPHTASILISIVLIMFAYRSVSVWLDHRGEFELFILSGAVTLLASIGGILTGSSTLRGRP